MKLQGDTDDNSNMSATDWILQEARSLMAKDIFAARSWLLTAKSMFPKSFSVQYDAYRLEYAERNAEQCSSLLGEMFQSFPMEPAIWKELETLIFSLDGKDKDDIFKQDVFGFLPTVIQRQMILTCAERQADITQHCKLMLALMEKFPETIVDYGVSLAEKLVEEEKNEGAGSPVNHHRKLLVCEVLPVICRSTDISVSHKHFYKWLQKAAEFYATLFTTDPKQISSMIGKVQQTWGDVEKLRSLISLQCGWESAPESNKSLMDRMSHIKDLHRRSRTDLTGNINKKQVFYTAILLLFEGASKYVEMLEPKIYKDQGISDKESRIVVVDWSAVSDGDGAATSAKKPKLDQSDAEQLSAAEKSLKVTFLVARGAWNALHMSESSEKDFSHLYRRWKMDRWVWLQLFLADMYTYEGKHKSALTRLNNLMELDLSKFRPEVILRCHCQLVSSYYASDRLLMACQSIIEALGHIPERPTGLSSASDPMDSASNFTCVFSPGDKLKLVPVNFSSLLPFWVHIFITSFLKILSSDDEDTILGHLIVLSQYEWPKWQDDCSTALDKISKKSKYTYPLFFDYVVSIDILEEISYLKSNSSCEMILLPDAPTSSQRITRGVNRGATEDFKKAMKRQVRKSGDCLETLLQEFLTKQQDSLLNCLQSETSQEILEPMDIDL